MYSTTYDAAAAIMVQFKYELFLYINNLNLLAVWSRNRIGHPFLFAWMI